MRRLAFVVMLVLLACGEDPAPPKAPAPPTHDVTGTIEAPLCEDGYDIVGASVTLRDGEQNIIASDTTTLIEEKEGFAGMIEYCLAGFALTDVPERDFYEVEIGTHGGPSYSLAEMEAADWKLELSLD